MLDSGNADADHLFHLIVVVISLWIIAHSSTDVPIAGYFARLEKQEAARTLGGDQDPARTRLCWNGGGATGGGRPNSEE